MLATATRSGPYVLRALEEVPDDFSSSVLRRLRGDDGFRLHPALVSPRPEVIIALEIIGWLVWMSTILYAIYRVIGKLARGADPSLDEDDVACSPGDRSRGIPAHRRSRAVESVEVRPTTALKYSRSRKAPRG